MTTDPVKDGLKIVTVCLLWYACSTSDNIIGKVVLTDFPYPMTVTTVQLVAAAVLLGPIVNMLDVPPTRGIDRTYFLTMILPLAVGKFVSSVTSYISIWKVSVSYTHTVKATLPMFTVILSRLITGDKQTTPVYVALLPIIGGVVVATLTEISFDYVGLISALFGTFCFSLHTIFSKKCLKDTGLHHLRLLILLARIATVLVIPFWLVIDFRRIIHDEDFMDGDKKLSTLLLLLVDGLFSMMHNVFAFTLLSMVSSLSYAVANATKRIVIISGSLIVLQNPITPMNFLGMMVAVFGVLLYNKAKYDQNELAKRAAVLPYVHSDPALHKLGQAHLPHSKSDANLNGLTPNGHILLREWHNTDHVTIIPISPRLGEEEAAMPPANAPGHRQVHSSNAAVHSRSIHHV